MGFDLELLIVPPQIEVIRKKAESNSAYGEEVSFLPRVIKDEKWLSRYWNEHPHTKEFTDDVRKLKTHFSYSNEDFFCETGRESSTLDYLLDALIDDYDFSALPKRILWNVGEPFANVTGGQGIPVRIYSSQIVKEISEFLSIAISIDLMKNYDHAKMLDEGVYKLTHPDNKEILSTSFERIKTLFRRAAEKKCLIMNFID